jgi:hypothetical protein
MQSTNAKQTFVVAIVELYPKYRAQVQGPGACLPASAHGNDASQTSTPHSPTPVEPCVLPPWLYFKTSCPMLVHMHRLETMAEQRDTSLSDQPKCPRCQHQRDGCKIWSFRSFGPTFRRSLYPCFYDFTSLFLLYKQISPWA